MNLAHCASQRVVQGTLETIAGEASRAVVRPPALLVIGNVVERRSELAWFESLPLFGQRILVTRPIDEAERSAALLESLGAEVLLAPTVEILPVADPGPLDRAIEDLRNFDWLVFTSSNGVRFFVERMLERGLDVRALGHLKIAAIGPGTAQALARYHLLADLVPDTFRSEALAEALAARASGCRILLARADRGRTVLKEELAKVAQVDQVAVYRNADSESLPEAVVERIASGTVDWIMLTSSAIAARLHALLPEPARARIGRETRLASLSPGDLSDDQPAWLDRGRRGQHLHLGRLGRRLSCSTSSPSDPTHRLRTVDLMAARRRAIYRSSRIVSTPCQSRNAPPRMNRISIARFRPNIPATRSRRKIKQIRPAIPIAV